MGFLDDAKEKLGDAVDKAKDLAGDAVDKVKDVFDGDEAEAESAVESVTESTPE